MIPDTLVINTVREVSNLAYVLCGFISALTAALMVLISRFGGKK